MPEEKRKLLRKGVENKKIYYSHKKVKLNFFLREKLSLKMFLLSIQKNLNIFLRNLI